MLFTKRILEVVPDRSGGCVAQAWSVAEVWRAWWNTSD
jgi:glycogen debranching enzyme